MSDRLRKFAVSSAGLAAVAAGVASMVPSAADAALILDLRFTGGVKDRVLTAADNGTTVQVFVFARVTGSLGSNTAYTGLGLSSANIMVASAQAAGLAVVSGSGNGFTTPFVLAAPWTGAGSSGQGGAANNAAIPNRDPAANSLYNSPNAGPNGLADYGIVTVAGQNNQGLATTANPSPGTPWLGGGSVGNAVDATDVSKGWEFPLGSFSFTINTVNLAAAGSTLSYNLRTPTNFTLGTHAGSGAVHATWFEDASTNVPGRRSARGFQTAANNGTAGNASTFTATFGAGAPITFSVPGATGGPSVSLSLTSTASFAVVSNSDVAIPGGTKPGSTTPGVIQVTGGGAKFVSEIDTLTGPSFAQGSGDISGLGTLDAGRDVYAMLWLSGSAGDIATLLATLSAQGGADYVINGAAAGSLGTEWGLLQTNYGGSALGAFNYLVKFNNPGAVRADGAINFDFTGSGVQVTALAVVPEPGMIGLAAVGGLGLLARRRRSM